MSHHAMRIIVQWEAASSSKSKGDPDPLDENIATGRTDVSRNELPLDRVHEILKRMSEAKVNTKTRRKQTSSETAPAEEVGEDHDEKALQQSSVVSSSMQLTTKLWDLQQREWPKVGAASSRTPYQKLTVDPVASLRGAVP